MSLVGTRPPTVDEWEKYELHHRSRMSTKPGITGMWQVSGRSDITDAQIALRQKEKLLPSQTRFLILPDPDGKRVGSGGATLNVLRAIAEAEGTGDFTGKKILVIHSGGDSKRVPQYSAMGKLFSPVPHELPDGRTSTLFDEFMAEMSGVAGRIREGMVLLMKMEEYE